MQNTAHSECYLSLQTITIKESISIYYIIVSAKVPREFHFVLCHHQWHFQSKPLRKNKFDVVISWTKNRHNFSLKCQISYFIMKVKMSALHCLLPHSFIFTQFVRKCVRQNVACLWYKSSYHTIEFWNIQFLNLHFYKN